MNKPAESDAAHLREQIAQFHQRITLFGPVIFGTKPSEPLSTHNAWMVAEYDGKMMVYARVLEIMAEVFGAIMWEITKARFDFRVGDPVAILDPDGHPLRFGQVVEQPAYQNYRPDNRIHVCWDGNPPHRTYSFRSDEEHRVVNLRDPEPEKEEGMRKLGMEMSNDRGEIAISGYLTLGQVRQVIGGSEGIEPYFEVELDDRLKGTRRQLPGSTDMIAAMRMAALGVLCSARNDKLSDMDSLLKNTAVAHALGITESDIPGELPPAPKHAGAQSTDNAE